jgi:hypothetical protein
MSYSSRSIVALVYAFCSSSESIIYFPLYSFSKVSISISISMKIFSSLSLLDILSLLSSEESLAPFEKRLFFCL